MKSNFEIGSSDPARFMLDRPFRLALAVTPPFGVDHIVAVSADSPLHTLNAELACRLNGRPAARAGRRNRQPVLRRKSAGRGRGYECRAVGSTGIG